CKDKEGLGEAPPFRTWAPSFRSLGSPFLLFTLPFIPITYLIFLNGLGLLSAWSPWSDASIMIDSIFT
ncbi:MAG: hypothetical protein ACFNM8_06965, partial [Prevotella histicola]|uniref:hypothetical protein n=1 Tax=Prevotella histicola TaxID=470565 RepID=UPI003616BD79